VKPKTLEDIRKEDEAMAAAVGGRVQSEPLKRFFEGNKMNWLIRAFSSSIGKKQIMAVTGLGFSLFVLTHLLGT
jgi:hypothetical protein